MEVGRNVENMDYSIIPNNPETAAKSHFCGGKWHVHDNF